MGSVSKTVGRNFEQDFYKSCADDYLLVRLKDGKGYGKNPADYI